jgi:SNF2 family DNA or RNA helicase
LTKAQPPYCASFLGNTVDTVCSIVGSIPTTPSICIEVIKMAKIYTKGSSIYVSGTLNEEALSIWFSEGLIFKMPYKRTLYAAPLSNLAAMLAVYPKARTEALSRLEQAELSRAVATEELVRYGVDDEDPECEQLGLWPHQVMGVRLARINKRFGFWFDTRTGKTRMMIQAIYEALREGRCRRALVVCPTTIIPSWLKDFEDFKPELKVVAYYGTDKQKRTALTSPCHVFIISLELVVKNIDLLRQIGFNYCVVDESSKLKSYKTKISTTLLDYSKELEYWYLLSATPAPNNEAEYWTQMRSIDEYLFPPIRGVFTSMYFDNVSRNSAFEKLCIKPTMKQALMSKVALKSVSVDQSVMPTAGKEWHVVRYALDSSLLSIYTAFRKNAVIELEDATKISTDMIAAINAKLCQITSGFIIDTDAKNENALLKKIGEIPQRLEIYQLQDNKQRINVLRDLLSKLGQQVVIWACYRQEFADIKELLGDSCRVINGSTPTRDKFEYIKQFKAGQVHYLICHPASVGMGINLTEAHDAVYYSLTYSYELLKQSSERICGHIDVQPNKCHFWVLAANGTIDECVYKNVMQKKTSAADFLAALKEINNESCELF